MKLPANAANQSSVYITTNNVYMEKYQKPANSKLNKKQIKIKKKKHVNLLSVKYHMNNSKIASINDKGILTARKSGKTKLTIKVNYKLNGNKENQTLYTTVYVKNHKHKYIPIEAICASCTEKGYITYKCNECKEETIKYTPIDPNAHNTIEIINGKRICKHCKKEI